MPWEPPAVVSEGLKAEAAAALRELEAALAREAAHATVLAWLENLGVLVSSGRMTATDAKLKLGAYSAMLVSRYSAAFWTDESLHRVARACKWFPDYAELFRLLDDEAARQRSLRSRLRRLAGIVGASRARPANITPAHKTWDPDRAFVQVGDAVKTEQLTENVDG